VQDRSNEAEFNRLKVQDQMVNASMGGPLAACEALQTGPLMGRGHAEKPEVEILNNLLKGLTNSLNFYMLGGTSVPLWSQKRRGEK
jgi:hypothetical protein